MILKQTPDKNPDLEVSVVLSYFCAFPLAMLVNNLWLCLVPVFPPLAYHFGSVFTFWCVWQRAISVAICILVQVTKTHCPLADGNPLKNGIRVLGTS